MVSTLPQLRDQFLSSLRGASEFAQFESTHLRHRQRLLLYSSLWRQLLFVSSTAHRPRSLLARIPTPLALIGRVQPIGQAEAQLSSEPPPIFLHCQSENIVEMVSLHSCALC